MLEKLDLDTQKPVAGYAVVRQVSRAYFKHLWIKQPVIFRILSGEKRVGGGKNPQCLKKGTIGVFSPGESLDIENIPDGEGLYRAEFIILLDASLAINSKAIPTTGKKRGCVATQEFLNTFLRTKDTITEDLHVPQTIVSHRISELIVWLNENNIFFKNNNFSTIVEIVRHLISDDVSQQWTFAKIAEKLHVSEPTLRRRLRTHGTSFTGILTDLRMSRALEMLQTTDIPITTIAMDVGYNSPSRFSARFKARFDLSPIEIRRKFK